MCAASNFKRCTRIRRWIIDNYKSLSTGIFWNSFYQFENNVEYANFHTNRQQWKWGIILKWFNFVTKIIFHQALEKNKENIINKTSRSLISSRVVNESKHFDWKKCIYTFWIHFRTFSVSNPYSSARNNFVEMLNLSDKIKYFSTKSKARWIIYFKKMCFHILYTSILNIRARVKMGSHVSTKITYYLPVYLVYLLSYLSKTYR